MFVTPRFALNPNGLAAKGLRGLDVFRKMVANDDCFRWIGIHSLKAKSE